MPNPSSVVHDYAGVACTTAYTHVAPVTLMCYSLHPPTWLHFDSPACCPPGLLQALLFVAPL